MWCEHKRPDWYAPHRGGFRLQHSRGADRELARDDGTLRPRRNNGIGLAERSLQLPVLTLWLLWAARALAHVFTAGIARTRCRAGRFRSVLRPRLDRDGAADRATHGRGVW